MLDQVAEGLGGHCLNFPTCWSCLEKEVIREFQLFYHIIIIQQEATVCAEDRDCAKDKGDKQAMSLAATCLKT